MVTIFLDTTSIGFKTTLRLKLISDTDTNLPSTLIKYQTLNFVNYENIPVNLLSEKSYKLHIDNESPKEVIESNFQFIQTIFKASYAKNKLISLLVQTETPNILGIIYPSIPENNPYTIRIRYIDLTDDYVSAILHPKHVQQPLSSNIDEPQSTLVKSLNAHIIRRKHKSTSVSSSVTSMSASTGSPPTQIPSELKTIRANNFIPILERLIKGEFRMRRLDSRMDTTTLRRLEKLMIRSVLFKFRNRSGVQDCRDNAQSMKIVRVTFAEIGETLDDLMHILI